MPEVILSAQGLVKYYPIRKGVLQRVQGQVKAVDGVSFDLHKGETLGIVGESGCGKSTLGRLLMRLEEPTEGKVVFDGEDFSKASGREMRRLRRNIQIVFQDPYTSLNPRMTVGDIIGEPLKIWGRHDSNSDAKIAEVLDAVGLDVQRVGERRPHEFSGGQCQRISIARSLVLDPEVLICDEPVSALDVSVQAQILNLLKDAKTRYGLTMVFIAHDLGVVKNISNRVAVVYLGKMCEVGAADGVYDAPAHPYTAALLESVPVPDPGVRPTQREITAGDIPSPVNPPSGCRYRTRCPHAEERCAAEEPQLRQIGSDHYVACHFPLVSAPRSDASSAQQPSADAPC